MVGDRQISVSGGLDLVGNVRESCRVGENDGDKDPTGRRFAADGTDMLTVSDSEALFIFTRVHSLAWEKNVSPEMSHPISHRIS